MIDSKEHFLDQAGAQESFDPDLKRAFEFAEHSVDPAIVDYSKVKIRKDKVLLSGDQMFYTLQGEGPTMGFPTVFVRFHVCNLRCTWCDAYYTWNPNSEGFWTESEYWDFENVAEGIWSTWAAPKKATPRVVFTGGEPLIQRKQIDQVMASLVEKTQSEWAVEIETNGTLMPTEEQLRCAQFNCSPKLANSDNKDYSRIKPKVLAALNEVNTNFKFVCMTVADLDEIERDFSEHIDHDKIIIMPQGVTEEEVSANAKVLVEDCKARGLRLLPRLQNICWDGARRRV